MLTVDTIGRIRRKHFLQSKTIKEIARDLRYLGIRSARCCGQERHPSNTIGTGRWMTDLDEPLAGNASKSAREQLTLIRIFEELRGRGYDGLAVRGLDGRGDRAGQRPRSRKSKLGKDDMAPCPSLR
jgi:hypothetical protein